MSASDPERWIDKILEKSISKHDIDLLSAYLAGRAERILSRLARSFFWTRRGYTLGEFALVCVEGLVETRRGISCRRIFRYFSSGIVSGLVSEESIHGGLDRLVFTACRDALVQDRSDDDGNFRKIHESVRRYLRSNAFYCRMNKMGYLLAGSEGREDPPLRRCVLSEDELLELLSSKRRESSGVGLLVDALFHDVQTREGLGIVMMPDNTDYLCNKIKLFQGGIQ